MSLDKHECKYGNSRVWQVIQLQGKLSTEESRNGELLQALNSEGKQLQKSTERCSELMNTASSLRRNVHRSEMRYHRAKETRCHAIEKAVDRARMEFESSETKTVKRPDGRIEDWVRHLVVELVALDGVPTAKVPQVIERVRRNFSPNGNVPGDQVGGNAKKQTISDRSVRRMLVESYVKAFLWAAELFNEAPCQYCNLYHPKNSILTSNCVESLDREWRFHVVQGRWDWITFCHLPTRTLRTKCHRCDAWCAFSPLPRFYPRSQSQNLHPIRKLAHHTRRYCNNLQQQSIREKESYNS